MELLCPPTLGQECTNNKIDETSRENENIIGFMKPLLVITLLSLLTVKVAKEPLLERKVGVDRCWGLMRLLNLKRLCHVRIVSEGGGGALIESERRD